MLTHHVLDSLSIAAPLDAVFAGIARPRVLDVGTGAGLPGIPLAVVRPSWSITLLDSNGKKTAFVQQAVADLNLSNATVVTGRAESHRSTYDAIVSRAYASLRDFTATTEEALTDAGTWAAMKGQVPDAELRDLPDDVRCERVVPLHVPGLDAERHLVLMRRSA